MTVNLPWSAQELRQYDPDHFALTLFEHMDRRTRLWPVFSLNLELSRIRHRTPDPTLRAIRFQWWRDAVASGAQTHPVLSELAQDQREALQHLITAHEDAAAESLGEALISLCAPHDPTPPDLTRRIGLMTLIRAAEHDSQLRDKLLSEFREMGVGHVASTRFLRRWDRLLQLQQQQSRWIGWRLWLTR